MSFRRRPWILALAALLPAAGLGFLAFRSLRSEEAIRRSEADDQVRHFLRAAAEALTVPSDAEALKRALNETSAAPPDRSSLPDLQESIKRERPDLVAALATAERLEFAEDKPAAAARLYLEMEPEFDNSRIRGRLVAAAARSLRKAGPPTRAAETYARLLRDFEQEQGDSLLPLGVLARLQLIALDVDRELHVRALLDAPLDPASELIVLERLEAMGIPARNRLNRARAIITAQGRLLKDGDIASIPVPDGLWDLVMSQGVVRDFGFRPYSSPDRWHRVEELARIANVRFGLRRPDHRWLGQAMPEESLGLAVPTMGVHLYAAVEPGRFESAALKNKMLLGGLIVFLVGIMAAGLVATMRAANREMRLARLKSDFISGVSHELRTPLTSIRIFSDLLSTPGPAEKREEHAALLKRESERLSGLVERVLDFSRLEKGGSYRLEERDLAAVVEEAVRTFRAPRPGFSVRVTTEPATARVDALGVEQIVHNLLDNAAKYAGPDTELVLRREAGRAILEVKDRGPGIAAADLPHVFETFYRGPSTTPGTGLGLSIVRQIAEAHGGSVRVASAPQEGATFTVEIPLCRASSS